MNAPIAILARGLSVQIGAKMLVDSVDLTLRPGTVTALMGPNGAGKTTLLRCLAGLTKRTSGTLHYKEGPTTDSGTDSTQLSSPGPRQLAIALGDTPMPFPWTALEIVLMGRAPHIAAGRLERPEDLQAANAALERVDASELSGRIFNTLSAGERQRVLLARTLAQDAAILLWDEPTSHQDPAHALRLSRLAGELAAEGRTLAMVLHDPNLAARTADTLVFMVAGQIVAAGPPDTTLTPEILRQVYGVSANRVADTPPAILWQ